MRHWGFLRGLSTIVAAAFVIGTATSPLRATTYFLIASDSGWFADNGEHISGDTDYEIGDTETTSVLRMYATFFMQYSPGLGQKWVSASLTLTNGTISTSDPSETATFFDVSTSGGVLSAHHSPGDSAGIAAYNDLGTGTIYGSQVYSPSDPAAGTKTLTLDSAALDALNAVPPGGTIAIGGAVTTLDAVDNIEVMFIGTNKNGIQLALTSGPATPEPASAATLGLIAAGFVAQRKRLSR